MLPVFSQFRADITPALCPQFRAGVPSYFFLYLKPLPGFSLPTEGKVQLFVTLNGIVFPQEFSLESPLGGPYLISLWIPPKVNHCQLFFQGALSGEQTTVLPSPYPSRNRLGGMLTRLSRQSNWQSLLNTPRSQIYALDPKMPFLPDFRFLDTFDFLVLDELAPLLLTQEWQEHLHTWLMWGGSLILTEEILSQPFLDQIALPPLDVFEWEKTLGDQLHWDSWKISPDRDVFWTEKKPYLISYSVGRGKILLLHHERAKNYPKLSDEILPLLYRVPPTVVNSQAYLPFQLEPPTPDWLIYVSLGTLLLYSLNLFCWARTSRKNYIVVGFVLFALLFYGVIGKDPIRYQSVSLSWVSTNGKTRWQRLFQFTSMRGTQFSLDWPSSLEHKRTSVYFPLFYEVRDVRVAEQEKMSLTQLNEKTLFWQIRFSPNQIHHIPLKPSWNSVFEQKGTSARSSRVEYKGGSLHNPTPYSFTALLFWKAGEWFYFDSLPSGAVLPLPSAEKSVEALLKKLTLAEAKVFHYLQKNSPPTSSSIQFVGFSAETDSSFPKVPGLQVAHTSVFIFE